MDTTVTLADQAPVTLSRPIPDGPTISIPVNQELTPTTRTDAGVGDTVLERTVGNIVKSNEL